MRGRIPPSAAAHPRRHDHFRRTRDDQSAERQAGLGALGGRNLFAFMQRNAEARARSSAACRPAGRGGRQRDRDLARRPRRSCHPDSHAARRAAGRAESSREIDGPADRRVIHRSGPRGLARPPSCAPRRSGPASGMRAPKHGKLEAAPPTRGTEPSAVVPPRPQATRPLLRARPIGRDSMNRDHLEGGVRHLRGRVQDGRGRGSQAGPATSSRALRSGGRRVSVRYGEAGTRCATCASPGRAPRRGGARPVP